MVSPNIFARWSDRLLRANLEVFLDELHVAETVGQFSKGTVSKKKLYDLIFFYFSDMTSSLLL